MCIIINVGIKNIGGGGARPRKLGWEGEPHPHLQFRKAFKILWRNEGIMYDEMIF